MDDKSKQHYMYARNPIKHINDYKKIGEVSGSVTHELYKEKSVLPDFITNLLNAWLPEDKEYVIKKSGTVSVIKNFIAAYLCKQLLGFRISEEGIIIGEKGELLTKSTIIKDYQPILHLPIGDLTTVNGLEELIAIRIAFGEIDAVPRNTGIITVANGEKYFVGIDHDGSLTFQSDANIPESCFERFCLKDYGEDLLITEKFANTCENVSKLNIQHLHYHIEYAVDYVEKALESSSLPAS